jgi:hypothetical protein
MIFLGDNIAQESRLIIQSAFWRELREDVRTAVQTDTWVPIVWYEVWLDLLVGTK